jgi:hypothetical protein
MSMQALLLPQPPVRHSDLEQRLELLQSPQWDLVRVDSDLQQGQPWAACQHLAQQHRQVFLSAYMCAPLLHNAPENENLFLKFCVCVRVNT